MRILLAFVIAGSLAACTGQADSGVGRSPPETGRAVPTDTGMQTLPPGGAPDTAMGSPTHHDSTPGMRHDSL